MSNYFLVKLTVVEESPSLCISLKSGENTSTDVRSMPGRLWANWNLNSFLFTDTTTRTTTTTTRTVVQKKCSLFIMLPTIGKDNKRCFCPFVRLSCLSEMRCSVVFGVTSRLLVINISSSSPAINTAVYCQRCVITCDTVAVVHRRPRLQHLPVAALTQAVKPDIGSE